MSPTLQTPNIQFKPLSPQTHILTPSHPLRPFAPKQGHLCCHQELSHCPFLALLPCSSLFWRSHSWGHLAFISAIPPARCTTRVASQDLARIPPCTALSDPCREFIYLLCGPLCNLYKVRVLASSRTHRNYEAAQISPNFNILALVGWKRRANFPLNSGNVLEFVSQVFCDQITQSGIKRQQSILASSMSCTASRKVLRELRLGMRIFQAL